MRKRNSCWGILVLLCLFVFSGCGAEEDVPQPQEELPPVELESTEEPLTPQSTLPTEEDVLAARQLATEGMSQEQIDRLTQVISSANLWWEHKYMNGNIFERLSDPNHPAWNYFEQTGEIQIGWAYDGSLDMDAVCESENLSSEEFYAKYGTRVVTENDYDADAFISILSELEESAQSEELKAELQDLIVQVARAKETHRMEVANYMYQKLHDLDYFLLRYGPTAFEGYTMDKSTVSKYYGTLGFFR